jgi:LytS/YehU family sensor histidine kinase
LIEIENDHSPHATTEAGDGVGLANTIARLAALYGAQGALSASAPDRPRFLVSIRFPLSFA